MAKSLQQTANPVEVQPITKEAQLARSPGNRCKTTGLSKRDCKCRPCIGRRARNKGATKQRAARKAIEKAFGQSAAPTSATSGQEEAWRLSLRLEVKSGGMAKTVDTFYRNTRAQSDVSKAIGDFRAFGAVAMPDGDSLGYLVIRLNDLPDLISSLRESWS